MDVFEKLYKAALKQHREEQPRTVTFVQSCATHHLQTVPADRQASAMAPARITPREVLDALTRFMPGMLIDEMSRRVVSVALRNAYTSYDGSMIDRLMVDFSGDQVFEIMQRRKGQRSAWHGHRLRN